MKLLHFVTEEWLSQSVLTDYWARVMTFNQVLWKWALFKNLKFYPKSKVHIWEKHWVKYHHGSQLYYSSPMNLCLSNSHILNTPKFTKVKIFLKLLMENFYIKFKIMKISLKNLNSSLMVIKWCILSFSLL